MILDSLDGLDHATVVTALKLLRQQAPRFRSLYLEEVIAKREGKRIRDLVEAAYHEGFPAVAEHEKVVESKP